MKRAVVASYIQVDVKKILEEIAEEQGVTLSRVIAAILDKELTEVSVDEPCLQGLHLRIRERN